MIKNKRGDDKYLSPWNFLIWGVMFITIVSALVIFNSSKNDVRDKEVKIITERILDCIITDGKLKPSFLSEYFNIFEECYLSEYILTGSEDYYFNITIYELNTDRLIKEITGGNSDLAFQCDLKNEEKDFAVCYTNQAYSSISSTLGQTDVIIKIKASSNYKGETPQNE